MPIGFIFRLNFNDRLPNILPLPQPISKILLFSFNLTCFVRNLLKDFIYEFDESQVLLSQFFNDTQYYIFLVANSYMAKVLRNLLKA